MELDGPRFFKLAWRLPAYSGVMAAIFAAEEEQETRPTAPRSRGGDSDRTVIGGTQAELASAFPDMFSMSKVDG